MCKKVLTEIIELFQDIQMFCWLPRAPTAEEAATTQKEEIIYLKKTMWSPDWLLFLMHCIKNKNSENKNNNLFPLAAVMFVFFILMNLRVLSVKSTEKEN
ncbi:hypothetical protein ILYODFUR_017209 [Ilyodon furcidens]|uniref:Uncharacterized protein n=1 Tax=Ilyodon furcidens TaxID=33524 RepID=A0ABV0VEP1_9TELE